MFASTKTQEASEVPRSKNETERFSFNDDVNTFDWVIRSLIDICEHEIEQAEQCALIVHKGQVQCKEWNLR